jgi:hypothetical protein
MKTKTAEKGVSTDWTGISRRRRERGLPTYGEVAVFLLDVLGRRGHLNSPTCELSGMEWGETKMVHRTDLQVEYVIGIEFECIEDAVYLFAQPA